MSGKHRRGRAAKVTERKPRDSKAEGAAILKAFGATTGPGLVRVAGRRVRLPAWGVPRGAEDATTTALGPGPDQPGHAAERVAPEPDGLCWIRRAGRGRCGAPVDPREEYRCVSHRSNVLPWKVDQTIRSGWSL